LPPFAVRCTHGRGDDLAPLHRELATGTQAGFLRRIGMTAEEFAELLR
jgi:hypothetical protein